MFSISGGVGQARHWLGRLTLPLVVSIVFFLQLLDTTIMNTSLPQMAVSFGVQPLEMGLGATSYSLVLACALPLASWASTRFGCRTVFTSATALFLVGSLGCGLAGRFWVFIAARVLQGLGGAAMNPVGRIIVLRTTPKEEFLAANNTITWPGLVAPLAGPLLGGLITSQVGWRWNFFMNLPLGLLAIGLALKFVPVFDPERGAPLDRRGFVLASTALGALLFGLSGICDGDPGAITWAALAWGIWGGFVAWRHLHSTPNPILQMSVLKIPSFRLPSLTAGMAARVAVSAVPFLLPIMLQTVLGLDPLETGSYLSVYFGGNFVALFFVTPLLKRFGFRKVMVLNSILVSGSIAAMIVFGSDAPTAIVWGLLFSAGVVRSIQFTGQSSLAYADIPPALGADAATLSSVFLQMSTSLGVVVATGALNCILRLTGRDQPGLTTFRVTFLAMAALPLLAAWLFRGLAKDAGAEMVGTSRRAA